METPALIPRPERTLTIDRAHGNRGYMRVLRSGCKWLDFEARKLGSIGFGDLDPVSQEGIVDKASRARAGSLPRVFFNVTREYGFGAYYAEPASWRTLGFHRPPQPEGYMDHAEAPR